VCNKLLAFTILSYFCGSIVIEGITADADSNAGLVKCQFHTVIDK